MAIHSERHPRYILLITHVTLSPVAPSSTVLSQSKESCQSGNGMEMEVMDMCETASVGEKVMAVADVAKWLLSLVVACTRCW